jgi:hypothetical protein
MAKRKKSKKASAGSSKGKVSRITLGGKSFSCMAPGTLKAKVKKARTSCKRSTKKTTKRKKR